MKIAIALSIGTLPLFEQVEEIAQVVSKITEEYIIILCGHKILDPKGCKMASEVAALRSDVVVAFADRGSFSRAYLAGWEKSVEEKADFCISMDADGSHNPNELPKFIDLFKLGNDVVCSSRFMTGAKNKYPFQRRVLSLGVTFLANTFLVPRTKRLTDFASGYEGLSQTAIKNVFKICPADKWVSVTNGPYHLQNTILRWLLTIAGYYIHEIPIAYGINRRGKVLGGKYFFQALYGFVLLIKQRQSFQ